MCVVSFINTAASERRCAFLSFLKCRCNALELKQIRRAKKHKVETCVAQQQFFFAIQLMAPKYCKLNDVTKTPRPRRPPGEIDLCRGYRPRRICARIPLIRSTVVISQQQRDISILVANPWWCRLLSSLGTHHHRAAVEVRLAAAVFFFFPIRDRFASPCHSSPLNRQHS